MADFFAAFMSKPPVTRYFVTGCLITTLAIRMNLCSPYDLYFNWDSIIQKWEVWRFVTTFFFFGDFGLEWLFHVYFLQHYLQRLEEGSFRGRSADLLYMLLVCGAALIVVAPLIVNMPFLGSPLTFMFVYVWARRNRAAQLQFLGVLNFRAPYLPWVLLVFGLILGQSPLSDLLGIFVGHVYWYLEDVYAKPAEQGGLGGPRVLKAPSFLQQLFDEGEDDVVQVDDDVNGGEQFNAGGFNWQ
eukprot:m.42654 g.42654  ORF g.42654 m.42654 type:complete len:242 (+) comp10723_c0_seq2:99-824(+)